MPSDQTQFEGMKMLAEAINGGLTSTKVQKKGKAANVVDTTQSIAEALGFVAEAIDRLAKAVANSGK